MVESWFVIALALGLGGFVKGVTGMGLPVVAIPLLATAFDLPSALSIMIVPVVVSNLWQSFEYRAHHAAVPALPAFLACGMGGVVVGTFLLAGLPRDRIGPVLGGVLIAYVALRLMRSPAPISPRLGRLLAGPVGFLTGILQGTTGLSSPVAFPYLHALRLERAAYLFVVSSLFLLFTLVQAVSMWSIGLLNMNALFSGALGLPSIFIMMSVGNRIGRLLNKKLFDIVLLSLMFSVAVLMIV